MYSFPLNEGEKILKKDHANMQKAGEAFHGALYLTNERLVFVGYMGDLSNKYMNETPLEHVQELLPEKTFYVIPNIINVQNLKDHNYKIIINNRDQWIQAINEQRNKII